jgi:hypothetical protein
MLHISYRGITDILWKGGRWEATWYVGRLVYWGLGKFRPRHPEHGSLGWADRWRELGHHTQPLARKKPTRSGKLVEGG